MDTNVFNEIKEIQEHSKIEDVNKLLQTENWKVVGIKIDKIKEPDGKIAVGMDGREDFWGGETYTRYEVQYKERLACLYILGKIK